ncbi:hypothetical protein Tco_0581764 [Tanacetum coccineum]
MKDDKATGTEIIDDVDKENVNVEVVLKKPKNKKLKRKEVIILDSDTGIYSLERSSFSNSPPSSHPFKKFSDNAFDSSSVSFKGRKGSTSKRGSCSKFTKTKPCKVLKFFDDSSSDDHGTVVRDDHGSVFRGKPGSSSKGVGVPKHSKSKQSNLSSCCKTVQADVVTTRVSRRE